MRVRILRNLILVGTLSACSSVFASAPFSSSIPVQKPDLFASAAPLVSSMPVRRPAFEAGNIPLAQTEAVQEVPQIELVMARRPDDAARQCNNAALIGEPIPEIPGRLPGCGIKEPVRITAVHGIELSRAASIDCETANAFADWVAQSVVPAFEKKKRDVAVIDILGSYQCRTRNNQPGAKISEHGKGKAIDVGSFLLDDQTRVSVFVDWNSRAWKSTMRAIHAEACDHFGTVLGPKADRFHKDHFHLDTARHRGGSYCR